MTATLRKGWCPGALAPMLSGDGYIFRLRLTNGILTFERAKVFADLARRFGNGAFDLSARANLQMRGVAGEKIADLQEELRALGLLDSDARAEAVRNVVPSPMAGFDPSAALDARPLVAALEALLARETALHDLPAKFGFSVDGGGLLPLQGVETDIAFAALPGAPPRLALSLGGRPAGELAPQDICAVAEKIARNFLRLRGQDRRMSAVVARLGVAPLLDGDAVVTPSSARDEAASCDNFLGAQPCGGKYFVGAGLLFGRIEADSLEPLAELAQAFGAAELRLTPWRAILVVGLERAAAVELAKRLAGLGFLLDARDSRLVFAACPGAPACSSARGDVRALALALAPHWSAQAGRVHISGCEKGCAFNAPALTLVAEADGYALIDFGLARERPSARGLDLAALQSRLISLAQGTRV
ncbi:precorrin-3B synthase [Rhodoblastus sp. 17X3]|uniref:precorrin-3B synthase n=1 Tax=Rhodoblastus sp. 17X3 TaxID=3047026 RepID=UPI0024B6413D|nr:precorrin-3B synthase [Rhodoblastus sp. 17X3]MDI9847604.1 precorrin-3B synthase [Rhodoblastus sp. 17X3]